MTTGKEWLELEDLAPEWQAIFGEPMPMGFEVTPDMIPLMKRCIREKTMEPLDAYLDLALADGRVY